MILYIEFKELSEFSIHKLISFWLENFENCIHNMTKYRRTSHKLPFFGKIKKQPLHGIIQQNLDWVWQVFETWARSEMAYYTIYIISITALRMKLKCWKLGSADKIKFYLLFLALIFDGLIWRSHWRPSKANKALNETVATLIQEITGKMYITEITGRR